MSEMEHKYNHEHDHSNGQFTGSGSSRDDLQGRIDAAVAQSKEPGQAANAVSRLQDVSRDATGAGHHDIAQRANSEAERLLSHMRAHGKSVPGAHSLYR
jgi:hypothetical protein